MLSSKLSPRPRKLCCSSRSAAICETSSFCRGGDSGSEDAPKDAMGKEEVRSNAEAEGTAAIEDAEGPRAEGELTVLLPPSNVDRTGEEMSGGACRRKGSASVVGRGESGAAETVVVAAAARAGDCIMSLLISDSCCSTSLSRRGDRSIAGCVRVCWDLCVVANSASVEASDFFTC